METSSCPCIAHFGALRCNCPCCQRLRYGSVHRSKMPLCNCPWCQRKRYGCVHTRSLNCDCPCCQRLKRYIGSVY